MTSQTIGNSTTRSAQATDFRKVLTYFFKKHNPSSVSKVDKLLNRYEGKESKLMLLLAKKYDCSNPLNRVFIDSVCEANCDASNDEYYLALTTLYLSIFYPQDANQAEALCATYKGKEEEMFKKLSSNFHAINPLKMKKKTSGEGDESIYERPIDYKKVLTVFYDKHDTDKVSDVDSILRKCKGREATLFSVFALKYSTSNALNAVFEDRLKDMMECKDHITLLKLYLSVFHPSCMPDAKLMLSKYQGKEEELFAKLATKFRACNPLQICTKLGKTLLGSIDEVAESSSEDDKIIPTIIGGYVSPKRRVNVNTIPQSPKVTP